MQTQFRQLLNFFIVVFVIITGYLVYWQLFWPTSAPAKGQDQNDYLSHKPCVASETPQRGNIFDRNGVLLAWSVPDPTQRCGWRRRYATDKHPSISAFLGYYSDTYGATGVERYYNDQLAGNISPDNFSDASQQWWNQTLHQTTYGQDLYLSIDIRIQDQVDKVFNNTPGFSQKCDGTQVGSIIVSDPQTGGILAMDSRPYFNGDLISDNSDSSTAGYSKGALYWKGISTDPCAPLINRAVSGQYTPGSVFKTVTLLGALESGQYDIHNSGFSQSEATQVVVDGRTITADPVGEFRNTPQPPTFPMDLAHAYAYSDNVIFARLGVALGADGWVNFAKKFAMSTPDDVQTPPIDLKEAQPSYIYPNLNGACQGTNTFCQTLLADSAFGQGKLFLTPLTMNMITSAVANDGTLYAPHLGMKLVPHGASVAATPALATTAVGGGPIFSAHTAQGVREAMRDDVLFGTVGASGSGWQGVVNSSALIGGKTGTAQISDATPHPTSWFISLAPYDAGGGQAHLAMTIVKENADSGAYQSLISPDIYEFALPLLGH
jgi:peptidoglycan glycosyltransferase